MALNIQTYNPGFLTDEQLMSSFCVRVSEYETIVETLTDTTAGANPHTIVIGPRGSGKTYLLLRIAAEARLATNFAGLFPIVFAEESYEVATVGEFWLECLGHLAVQAPVGDRNGLNQSYQCIRSLPVGDDRALANRCLSVLMNFSNQHNKRLLLIVENLNMLFGQINDRDAGWRLRKYCRQNLE